MRMFLRSILFFLCLIPTPLWAASSAWQQSDEVAVRLIAANEGTKGLSELNLGLEVFLATGWHTYWRTPGESGAPPQVTWNGSDNLASATLLYPAPQRISSLGLETIGYKERVTFPLRAKLKKQGEAVTLNADLTLLICKTLCLPKQFHLTLALPAQSAELGLESPLIDRALEKIPESQSDALLISEVTRGENALQITVQGREKLRHPDLFIEDEQGLTFSTPTSVLSPDGLTARFTIPLSEDAPKATSLKTLPLTLTVVDDDIALEKHIESQATASDIPQHNLPSRSLLLLALLGGFILNFMPCVLPVLSLKVMALIRHGGGQKHHIRRSFLATASGILFSFALLAFATAGLKATGQAIGWGVQFQHPVFLVFMIAVLSFFAANLWGFFTIGTPSALTDLADPHHHPKLAGDFATGALATLLATPCSAPFLGTAVAFAMASGFVDIVLVFMALGLGMSLPYLALAAWPRCAAALPKPGAWMMKLSRLLGFGLAGTALWLLVVLRAQMGTPATLATGLLMAVMIALLAWPHHKRLTRPLIACALIGAFILAFLAAVPTSAAPTESSKWQKFDEETLTRHLLDGKTVFVDVTADWCMTCKFNKRFALSRESVSNRLFKKANIVALEADWTNPNPIITAFLKRHGRYGVPFAIVFGPQAPNGLPLPELLTPEIVLKALDKAQGPTPACPATLPPGTSC